MTEKTSVLKRDVGLFGVVSLGIGTAIGVSIFSILAPAVQLAGPAMLLAMVLSLIPMMIFGIVYAFMGSALSVTGASFEWPRRFVHPFLGFIVGWLRIAGSTAALIVLTMVLTSYIGGVVELPTKPVMFGIFLLVFALNLIGISAAAISQTLMLAVLLGMCALYTVTGLPKIEITAFSPFASAGSAGILAAIPLLISLFLGIETAVEVGGEIRRPERNIPLGIALSLLLTALIYGVVAAVTIGLLGSEKLAGSTAPLLDGAVIALGQGGQWLILVTAIVAIGSSINALFIIFTRFIFAMASAGMLPRKLAYVHSRSGVPRGAACLAFGMCLIGLFLPPNLIFLFLAVNIPTVLKYISTCVSALGLMSREPELYEKASFRPSRRMIYVLSGLGIVLGLTIIVLGFTADWRPYLALGVWGIPGVIWYFAFARRNAGV